MDSQSPVSRSFTTMLAKYAYSSSSISTSPRHPNPVTPSSQAGSSTSLSPIRQSRSSSRKIKRETRDDDYGNDHVDEDESFDEYEERTPTKRSKRKSEKGSRETKSPSETTTTKKNKKIPRPFAGPEVYAHLRPVQDLLKVDLDSGSVGRDFSWLFVTEIRVGS